MEPRRPERPQQRPCLECGGQRVFVELDVTAGSGYGRIALNQPLRTQRFRDLFSDAGRSDLYALVCIHCGYTSFFAKDPQNLIPRQ